MKNARYPSWGLFVKTRRAAKYRSARTFCTQMALGISYPQYSRYEAGEQLPGIEQALEIFAKLDVPVLEGVLEWNRAQMPTDESRVSIEGLLTLIRNPGSAVSLSAGSNPAPRVGADSTSLDETIVFNRSHLRLFSADPKYRDIFTFINSFAPRLITVAEVAAALDLKTELAERMIIELSDLGVVDFADGLCTATKKNFYFPDDRDFFDLRNMNLIHNATAILGKLKYQDISDRRAFRGLVTRELTREQMNRVLEQMESMIRTVSAFPETEKPERVYSVCLLLGERFTRRTDVPASTARFIESPVGTA